MPTVPQYELGQVQSSGVNGMQNISAPADAFGANVARAQSGMGQEISRQAEIMFQREQKVQQAYEKGVLRELDNNLSSYIRDSLTNQESGFMMLTGRNAMSAKGALVENINEYRKSLEKDLNPRMLNNWSTMADSRVNSANNTISDHVMRETINYNKTESASRLAGLAEDVKLAGLSTDDEGNNPEAQKYVAVGVIEINSQLMDEFGIDVNSPRDEGEQEIINNAHLKFTTLAHTSVIDSLIADQRPSVAKRYFEANQGEIDQATQDKIKKVLDTETQRAEAQRVTDEIRQNPDLDIKAQLEIAREIKDSALRDAVVERLKTRDAEDDAIATENQSIAYDAAQKLLTDHPQATSRTVIPADVFESMSGAQRLQIDNVLNARKKALLDANEKHLVKVAKRNKEIKEIEDQIRFNYLYDLAKNNFADFLKQDLNLYIGLMSETNLKTLKDLREGNQNLDLLGTVDEMINSTLSGLGWDTSKALDQGPDGETIRAFTNQLRFKMAQYELENGKGSANEPQVWQMLADMAADGQWRNTQITNEVDLRVPTDHIFSAFVGQQGWDITKLNTITKDGGMLTDFRIRVNQMEAEHYASNTENPSDVVYQKILNTAYHEMIADGTIEGSPSIPIAVEFRSNNNDMLAGVVAQLGLSMSDFDKQTPEADKLRSFVDMVKNAETTYWKDNRENASDLEYQRILNDQGFIFASKHGIQHQPNNASFTPDHKIINKQAFNDVGVEQEWLEQDLNTEQGERARAFNNRLTIESEEFWNEHGKNPTKEEWQDIVNNIVGDQVYVNGWSVPDKIYSIATLTKTMVKAAYVDVDGEQVFLDKISTVDRSRIKTTLQNNDMRDWAQDIAKLSLIPEDELANLIEAYYLKTGRKQQLSADLLYTSQKSFDAQKPVAKIIEKEQKPVGDKTHLKTEPVVDAVAIKVDDTSSSADNAGGLTLTPVNKKELKLVTDTKKIKDQYKAVTKIKQNTQKILKHIKAPTDSSEDLQKELDTINEYLEHKGKGKERHYWEKAITWDASPAVTKKGLKGLRNQQRKLISERKVEIEAKLKSLLPGNTMTDKDVDKHIKSVIDEIIETAGSAPTRSSPGKRIKWFGEEIRLIEEYLNYPQDKVHPWDEVFTGSNSKELIAKQHKALNERLKKAKKKVKDAQDFLDEDDW